MGRMDKVKVIDQKISDDWALYNADCVEVIKEIPDKSIDLSVFSPPFATLYTYSSSERDMGNSKDYAEFFSWLGFLTDDLLRVTKNGRSAAVHVSDIATTMVHHGVSGVYDFSGDVIKTFVKAGWIYDGRVTIDKDPQAQAIRTKTRALLFVQLEKDSALSRPAMADYILRFRVPGENKIPVDTSLSREEWIEWARPVWYGIRESETLNAAVAREEKDERHVCPLQLGVIERCIKLWSNSGDVVLSPFAGIGSEGYVALRNDRRFVGIELKKSYYETALNNLSNACRQLSLLDKFA
jgi:DNA modification methylase